MKHWFFVAFNIIISHIFPENFIEISHVAQMIWRISLSLLAIFNFHQFSDFLTFSCLEETNDDSLQQMMSDFFHYIIRVNKDQ